MKLEHGYFTRDATGLVRELSWFDAFLAGFGILNIGLGLVQVFAYAPFVFPGGNIPLAFILAIPGAFFLGLLNALFTAAMPRSGGDYVWVSRSISPVWGFAVNFFATFLVIAAAAVNIWYFDSIFLAPALSSLGLIGAANWIIATPAAALLLAIPALIILAFIFASGLDAVRKVMLILFIISGIGVLCWMAVMLFSSHAAFVSNFNAMMGADAYQSVVNSVSTASANPTPGVDRRNSLYTMIYAFQMYAGFQMIGYFSGEIKHVSRSAIQAIMTTLAVGAMLFVVGSLLIVNYFHMDFLAPAGYYASNSMNPSVVPPVQLPLGYYLSGLVIYMTDNLFLRAVISLGFLATILWILLPQMLIITRNMFAWSFDRLIPDWMANVNERTHSPVNATIVAAVLIFIMLVITLTTSFWSYLVNLVGVGALATSVVSIAGIIFPYRRKDIFEKSPSIVQRKFLKLPVITWAGIFTLLTELLVAFFAFTAPEIVGTIGAVTWTSLLSSLAVFLIAFPLYLGIRTFNKRRGLDPSLAYKELPPE